MRPPSSILHYLCLVIAAFVPISVQARAKPARLTFDVASIHPSKAGQQFGGIKALPGGHGYTATNVTVQLMISLMYKVPMRQIKGAPAWLNTDRFDVEARADGSYNLDDLHAMYQNLLADRFGLRFHKETREGPVYSLIVDPGGLKMTPNTSSQDFNIPMQGPPEQVTGKRVPMNYLTWYLGQVLQADQRPVIDNTGLKGNYDFTLSYQPVRPPGAEDALSPEQRALPSIFVALKEQLGLRLQPEKGPIEDLVIDHVEQPSAN